MPSGSPFHRMALLTALLSACNVAEPIEFTIRPQDLGPESTTGDLNEVFAGEENKPCPDGHIHAVDGTEIVAPCPLGTSETDTLGRLVDANFNPIAGVEGRPIITAPTIDTPLNSPKLNHHAIASRRELDAHVGAKLLGSADYTGDTFYASTNAVFWKDMIRYRKDGIRYRTSDVNPRAAYHITQIIRGTGCTMTYRSSQTSFDVGLGLNTGATNKDGSLVAACTDAALEAAETRVDNLQVTIAELEDTRENGKANGLSQEWLASVDVQIQELIYEMAQATEILALEQQCNQTGTPGPDVMRASGFNLPFTFYQETGLVDFHLECRGMPEPHSGFFFSATPQQVAETFGPSTGNATVPLECVYTPLPRFVCIPEEQRLQTGDMLDLVVEVRRVLIRRAGNRDNPLFAKPERWEWNMSIGAAVADTQVHEETLWEEQQFAQDGSMLQTSFQYFMSQLPSKSPVRITLGGQKHLYKGNGDFIRTQQVPQTVVTIDPEAAQFRPTCDPTVDGHWQRIDSGTEDRDSQYVAEVCIRKAFTP